MSHEQTIETLNDLIETCRNGEQGFRTAIEGVTDPQVRAVFAQYADQRAQFAKELQEAVMRLGGRPRDRGSVSASLHRGWMDIKSLVTGQDEQAIISEAERGEDVAKAAFDAALRQEMPRDTLALVERMAARVREAHDRVRAMEKADAR